MRQRRPVSTTVPILAALAALTVVVHAPGTDAPGRDDLTPEGFFCLTLAYGSRLADWRHPQRERLTAADRNGDGRVDQMDLLDFTAAWLAEREQEGQADAVPPPTPDPRRTGDPESMQSPRP